MKYFKKYIAGILLVLFSSCLSDKTEMRNDDITVSVLPKNRCVSPNEEVIITIDIKSWNTYETGPPLYAVCLPDEMNIIHESWVVMNEKAGYFMTLSMGLKCSSDVSIGETKTVTIEIEQPNNSDKKRIFVPIKIIPRQ